MKHIAETDPTIRRLRAETDHCPDCGQNMHEPDYYKYHHSGYCVKCNLCPVCGADTVAWKQAFGEEHRCEVNK